MIEERNGVRNWASILDEGTRLQAEKLARCPAVSGPVALMPDAHVGIGATVGSVIVTENAIIPAAVGVDIGCGMIACRTDLVANDLPDTLQPLISVFARDIPGGMGKDHSRPKTSGVDWMAANRHDLTDNLAKRAQSQLGTLGSGNHFLEVCLDEEDQVWVVVHSGSRGVGNQLAQRHIKLAREQEQALEDPDLAYFLNDTLAFKDYVSDMLWAQTYALQNREIMMDTALQALINFVGQGSEVQRINCHHNFAQQEEHDGRRVWVTRKGAIQTRQGDYGVIPGSMGDCSFIVSGLGNPLSYHSCAHGAGRLMSRTQAKKFWTVESLEEAMAGKAWTQNGTALLDEHPRAYKPIETVMADQADLVEIQATLHQIANYKGA